METAVKELSLNILDMVRNSIDAGADLIGITITESEELLTLSVKDNGRGMDDGTIAAAQSPFFTTRACHVIGMGIPLLKLAAEQTGGGISISSKLKSECPEACGTEITAWFYKSHVDFTPLGDIPATLVTIMQGSPEADIVFHHAMPDRDVALDTRDMRLILGEDADLSDPLVLQWVRGMLKEQYA